MRYCPVVCVGGQGCMEYNASMCNHRGLYVCDSHEGRMRFEADSVSLGE